MLQTKGGDAGGYHGKGQSLRYKNGYATTTGDSLMMVSGDSGGGGSTLHNTGVPLSDGTAEVRLGSTSPGLTNKPKWVEYDRQVRSAGHSVQGVLHGLQAASRLAQGCCLCILKDFILYTVADRLQPARQPIPAGTSRRPRQYGLNSSSKLVHASNPLTFIAGQVLRWFGYYTEEVPDSRIENVRIRKVVIRYYLENDTMDVLEPRQTNSGMDQAGHLPVASMA